MSAPLKTKVKWRKQPRRKWSAKEVALVDRLYSQGYTYAQIACNLGVTKGMIASVIRQRCDSPNSSIAASRWRIRQLLTAGYTPSHIAEWINVPLSLALEVLDEWESEA